jgi:hypothetical protein
MGDMNWRDKDDLDLTSEDIDAMIDEGQPVAVRGPRLPQGAVLVKAAATYGGETVYATPGRHVVMGSLATA